MPDMRKPELCGAARLPPSVANPNANPAPIHAGKFAATRYRAGDDCETRWLREPDGSNRDAKFKGVLMTEADLQQCEHCDNEFPIETMTSMEDCWFCERCVSAWRKEFDSCSHAWTPHVSVMGDEGRYCGNCSGFVANEDAAELGLS